MPILHNDGDLDNISSYNDVLKMIENKEGNRKAQAHEYYDGRRAQRKKCFFALQTFYPIFTCIFFSVWIVTFLDNADKNIFALMGYIQADWSNTVPDKQAFNSGNFDSRPFNDLIVLDANLTGQNECP